MDPSSSARNAAPPKKRKRNDSSKGASSTHTFLWGIENIIDSSPEGNMCTYSCEFETKHGFESKWCFELNVGSSMKFSAKPVKSSANVRASISICLLDIHFRERYKVIESKLFQSHKNLFMEFHSFLRKEELKSNKATLLHNSDLILYGEIRVLCHDIKPSITVNPVSSCYAKNMSELLEKGVYADFKIVAGGTEFLCHKAILASRSHYFDALLKNSMKEKFENLLVLEDIESDVLQMVLEYIYTNKIDISLANVASVLVAADKYLLDGLKLICEEKLQMCLNFSNMSNIFAIANTFCLQNLKYRTLRSWAMFTKQIEVQNEANSEGVSEEGMDQSAGCSASADNMPDLTPKFKETNYFLPPANIWISSKKHMILNNNWKVKDLLDNIYCSNSPMVYSFTNESFKISCDLKVRISEEVRISNQSLDSYKAFVMKLCFTLVSSKEKVVCMKFCSAFEDSSSSNHVVRTFFKNLQVGQKVEIFSVPDITEDSNGKLFHNGDLLIKCRCWIVNCLVNYQEYPVSKNTLISDVSSLITNLKFSDLVIKVKESSFSCHKAVLACRSPFLAVQIEQSSDGLVELKDIEPETFMKLLCYIYSDEYDTSEAEALELLPFAILYELEALKENCERILISKLSIENAPETLNYSIVHSALTLKDHTLKFVKQHFDRILEIPESFNQIEKYDLGKYIVK